MSPGKLISCSSIKLVRLTQGFNYKLTKWHSSLFLTPFAQPNLFLQSWITKCIFLFSWSFHRFFSLTSLLKKTSKGRISGQKKQIKSLILFCIDHIWLCTSCGYLVPLCVCACVYSRIKTIRQFLSIFKSSWSSSKKFFLISGYFFFFSFNLASFKNCT